jgi:LacI family transcriptional regulator
MAVRLKDIAQDLGLSIVTVSKVLRNHPDIGAATRERVLQRVKELNYQPNLTARSLVAGQTWTVGLVVPDLLHPFFAVIAKAISADIRSQGYSLFISSSDEDPELEMQEIQQLLARRVDVIMLASCRPSADGLDLIAIQNTPCVLIDRRLQGLHVDFVGSNDEQIGELATTHLLQQGCRRIAHICGPDVSTALGRLEGYKRAMARRGLVPLPEHIASVGDSGDHLGTEGGYRAAMKLLTVSPRPDGIFCYNDPSAMGAMRAILEAGLRVPEDMALVGCGNIPYSDSLRVPLTSVDQGSEAIGRQAAAMALRLAAQKAVRRKAKVELIPVQLVARESTRRFSRGESRFLTATAAET